MEEEKYEILKNRLWAHHTLEERDWHDCGNRVTGIQKRL